MAWPIISAAVQRQAAMTAPRAIATVQATAKSSRSTFVLAIKADSRPSSLMVMNARTMVADAAITPKSAGTNRRATTMS